MNNELKEQLLKLTIKEILELISKEPRPKTNPRGRYTIGKLDASVNSITDASRTIVEYSVDIPEGTLCHIKRIEDIESCIKELNIVITKYQK